MQKSPINLVINPSIFNEKYLIMLPKSFILDRKSVYTKTSVIVSANEWPKRVMAWFILP
jgi:hypothetical protein